MSRLTLGITASVLAASVVLGGCAADRPPEASADAASRSSSAENQVAEVFALANSLDAEQSAYVEQCMNASGYPEIRQAAALAQAQDTQGEREVFVADPLEAGPYTDEIARRYGFAGTANLFRTPEPGYVVSHNDSYDAALNDCMRTFDEQHGIAAAALLGDVTDFANQARTDYLIALRPYVEPILVARLDCVRDRGYPSLTSDDNASLDDILASVGIPAGVRAAQPVAPAPASLHEGVSIVPPQPVETYLPSDLEIQFALKYVECGNESDFMNQWQTAQVEPRSTVANRLLNQAELFAPVLREALSR